MSITLVVLFLVAAAVCFGVDFLVSKSVTRLTPLGLLLFMCAQLVGQVHVVHS
jgi:hypothetical protein